MSAEPDDQRERSAQAWGEAATGWERRQETIRAMSAPVAHWLVQAIDPQPGQRILELAAGVGETGFLAAELIRPGGTLITTDQAEAMVGAARRRAEELGVRNVEFKVMDAEWIDLPVASVDAVLCRWGLMLMTDPPVALREARRVLRSGGRLAVAVWDAAERNPWAAVPSALLAERGLTQRPAPDAPGPFALGDVQHVRELLEGAGFDDVEVDYVDVVHEYADAEAQWETLLDLSRSFHDAVMGLDAERMEELRHELRARLAPFTAESGEVRLPGRTLVATASA